MWPCNLQTAGGLDVSDCRGKLVDVLVIELAVNFGFWAVLAAGVQMKSSSDLVLSSARGLGSSMRKDSSFMPGNTA